MKTRPEKIGYDEPGIPVGSFLPACMSVSAALVAALKNEAARRFKSRPPLPATAAMLTGSLASAGARSRAGTSASGV